MMKRHHQVPAIIDHIEEKLKVKMDWLEEGVDKKTKEVQLQTEELRKDDSDCYFYPAQPVEGQGDHISQCDPFINLPTWFDDF
jgi:hypothetical protein